MLESNDLNRFHFKQTFDRKFPEIDAVNKSIYKLKCGVSTVKEQFGRTELNRLFLGSEINIF